MLTGVGLLVCSRSDHGRKHFAKWTVYEDGINVPMFIKHNMPGLRKNGGTRIDALMTFMDVVPTFVDLAGGHPINKMDGESFLPLLFRDRALPINDYIYGIHTNRGIQFGLAYPIRSISDGHMKLINNLNYMNKFTSPWAHADYNEQAWKEWQNLVRDNLTGSDWVVMYECRPEFELYDLDADPHELHNLAGSGQHDDLITEWHGKLLANMERLGDTGMELELATPTNKNFMGGLVEPTSPACNAEAATATAPVTVTAKPTAPSVATRVSVASASTTAITVPDPRADGATAQIPAWKVVLSALNMSDTAAVASYCNVRNNLNSPAHFKCTNDPGFKDVCIWQATKKHRKGQCVPRVAMWTPSECAALNRKGKPSRQLCVKDANYSKGCHWASTNSKSAGHCVPRVTDQFINCDIRKQFKKGSPARSACLSKQPYKTHCIWAKTTAFPEGQCIYNDPHVIKGFSACDVRNKKNNPAQHLCQSAQPYKSNCVWKLTIRFPKGECISRAPVLANNTKAKAARASDATSRDDNAKSNGGIYAFIGAVSLVIVLAAAFIMYTIRSKVSHRPPVLRSDHDVSDRQESACARGREREREERKHSFHLPSGCRSNPADCSARSFFNDESRRSYRGVLVWDPGRTCWQRLGCVSRDPYSVRDQWQRGNRRRREQDRSDGPPMHHDQGGDPGPRALRRGLNDSRLCLGARPRWWR